MPSRTLPLTHWWSLPERSPLAEPECVVCPSQIGKYPGAEIVWCQEEPKNAGAWQYVRPRIVTAARDLRHVTPTYAGRNPAASTATGYGSWHTKEIQAFLATALD